MAILATRRRWEVTSLWAASISWWSRQRWESASSSSAVSIGNLRISWRYRERLPSGATLMTAEATAGSFRLHGGRACPIRRTRPAWFRAAPPETAAMRVRGVGITSRSLGPGTAASDRAGPSGRAPAPPFAWHVYSGRTARCQESGPIKSGLSLRHAEQRPAAPACPAAAAVSKRSGAPVRGCAKPRRAACSAWRGKSSRVRRSGSGSARAAAGMRRR